MKNLKNFKSSLSREEMRTVAGGKYHTISCPENYFNCNFGSCIGTCNGLYDRYCVTTFCTDKNGVTQSISRCGC